MCCQPLSYFPSPNFCLTLEEMKLCNLDSRMLIAGAPSWAGTGESHSSKADPKWQMKNASWNILYAISGGSVLPKDLHCPASPPCYHSSFLSLLLAITPPSSPWLLLPPCHSFLLLSSSVFLVSNQLWRRQEHWRLWKQASFCTLPPYFNAQSLPYSPLVHKPASVQKPHVRSRSL